MESPSESDAHSPSDPNLTDAFGFDLDDESWVQRIRTLLAAPVPTRLGPFELVEEIGRGGQGVVYKALQPRTGRIIAIKRVTAAAHASSSFRTRFERELRTAASLNHPNIVTVYGCEVVDEQPLLLMEYIEGVPVDRWVRPEGVAPRGPREVLRLFTSISAAISCAHRHGVIHCDLKPTNVLVDAVGEPHLLDFGLARIFSPLSLGPHPAMHTTGFIGTPAYASPEHFSNDAGEVDVRSDIYSLGAMLYQALTGHPPFADRQRFTELARAVENVDPPRPSRVQPGLGRELDAIVLKTLAKSKADRYQSMDALTEDISRYLSGQPVLAHPPGTFYQLGKWIRRNKFAFASAVAFLALIAAFAVTATVLALREHAAKQDANWNSYVANIAAASAALRADDAASAQQHLDRAPHDLRDWEWRYFSQQADGSVASMRLDDDCVAVNDLGELVASLHSSPNRQPARTSERAAILTRTHYRRTELSSGLRWALSDDGTLIDVQSDRRLAVWPFPATYTTRFAPDERTLALADQSGGITLVSLPESVPASWTPGQQGGTGDAHFPLYTHVLQLFAVGIEALAFRADSQQLAASAGDGAIVIVDVPSAQVVGTMAGNGSPVWALAFSPDGRRLAAGSWDKLVTLWDLDTKQAVWKATGHRELIAALAFQADGVRLASGSWDKTIRVWDAEVGEPIAQFVGHTHEVGTVAFLGTSDRLVSFDAGGVLKTWNLTASNRSIVGGEFRRIEGLAGSLGSVRAGWIAVAEGQDAFWRNARLSLIDCRNRIKSRELWTDDSPGPATSSGLFSASASPDGRWLAAGAADGTILVWRGEELAAVVGGGTSIVPPPALLEISDPARCEPSSGSIKGPACFPVWLSFAVDSRRLAVSRLDGSIDVWDLESRTDMNFARPEGIESTPSACAFLGKGDRLAVIRGKEGIQIVDSRDGHTIVERRIPLNDDFVARFHGSPDGELIPLLSGKDVVLCRASDLSIVGRLSGHQRLVTAVTFSPDGKRLVSSSYDNTLKLWDVATAREVATLHGHAYRATCVLFVGETIISGGHDNRVHFWDYGN